MEGLWNILGSLIYYVIECSLSSRVGYTRWLWLKERMGIS